MIGRALRVVSLAAMLLVHVVFVSACSLEGRNLISLPPTATPAPACALPAPSAWLDYLNFYRAAAHLFPVTENTAWSDGARNHAIYVVKNRALHHDEHPGRPFYTPEGRTAARQSNVFGSANADDTDWPAIDAWMQSPFHAIGVLDPRLVQVGFGSYRATEGNPRTAAALNVIAGINNQVTAAYPIFWPGDGTTMPMGLHRGGEPSPLASCRGYRAPSGLPVIVQIGDGTLTPAVSATSFTQNGRPLEHCVFDETTYRNPDRKQQKLGRSILGARDAIVLVPRFPLTAGTTYTASVTAGGRAYTWSFSIGDVVRVQDSQTFSGPSRTAAGAGEPAGRDATRYRPRHVSVNAIRGTPAALRPPPAAALPPGSASRRRLRPAPRPRRS